MKIKFIVLLILFFTNIAFSQEKKCFDFKVGTFSYNNPIYKKYKVIRKETVQIETDTVTGLILEGVVEWKSDCQYVLTYTKVSNKDHEKILGQKINVDISNILGNTFVCKSEGLGIKMELEMTKIKD
ncbi:hypothetical protein [Flavobacterium chungangense]|uniref:hypothetical protein n=1 Tax=Flavobacterium chungangense TaxID=554283 RepID=UPI0004DF06EC|nr:hypothetical protein [Flavobacterium chungangense]